MITPLNLFLKMKYASACYFFKKSKKPTMKDDALKAKLKGKIILLEKSNISAIKKSSYLIIP
jgi:hypothetical protein